MTEQDKKKFKTVPAMDMDEYKQKIREHRLKILKRTLVTALIVFVIIAGLFLFLALRHYEDFDVNSTVEMYRDMLNTLLGDNRPKQPDKSVSLNRLLLISRICYLYEFTYNDSFLYSDDSLKGIIKSYKRRTPATYSAVYL
jgi:hypothetical protein